jgi:energy-coupling factor transport system permease protein
LSAGSPSRFLFAVSIALASAVADNLTVILVMILGAAAAMIFWDRGLQGLVRVLRTAVWFVMFLFVLHLFSHPGEKIFSILFLDATAEGAAAGIFYGLKLIAFACSAGIVLLCVDPFELILPAERASRWFGSSGKHLSSFAMALSLALRFLPDLSDDARTTLMAYRTRGIGLEGGLMRRGRVAIQLLGTMFVNAFKRAHTVSMALDIKGYSTRHEKAVFPAVRFSAAGSLVTTLSLAFLLWGWLA